MEQLKQRILEFKSQCTTLEETANRGVVNKKKVITPLRDLDSQLTEMKEILSANTKKEFFIFVIIDDGILQQVIMRESLSDLIQDAADALSDKFDDPVETADGYACVYSVNPVDEGKEHLWTYPFDGEETIKDSLLRLQKASLAG